ncbi:MAG: VOC family protein [Bryobacteraceae bacterium]
MPRPIHFELPADDPDRAVKFYADTFGWKIQKWDGPMDYWMVDTGAGPGINGGILRRPQPGATTVNTLGVESLDPMVEKVVAAGGKVALPRMAVPGVGYLAYCMDPEGNLFGMMENDPSAK